MFKIANFVSTLKPSTSSKRTTLYYPPFGSSIPELQYAYSDGADTSKYRFGFNNQEQDSELGEYYAFEYRIHDARLGRFLSVDPLEQEFPWNSPYSFAENNVIRYIELEGNEKADPEEFWTAKQIIESYINMIQLGMISDVTLINNLKLTQLLNLLNLNLDVQKGEFAPSRIGKLEDWGVKGKPGLADPHEGSSGGYFCGSAATSTIASNYDPVSYVNAVISLAFQGFYQDPTTGITITLPDFIKCMEFSSGGYYGFSNIGAPDIIFALAIRSNDNVRTNSDLTSQQSAGTLPWEIDDLFKYIGINIHYQRIYGGQSKDDLNNIVKAISNSLWPIIFENHLISGSGKDDKLGIHYIVLTSLVLDESNGTVTFSYISAGEHFNSQNGTNKTMSIEDFLIGMKAYYIPVMKGYNENSHVIQKNNNGSGMGIMEQADGLY